ncbi:MAG: hypothetical protein Tsb009_09770 [Planctomycetaceae bacterium]
MVSKSPTVSKLTADRRKPKTSRRTKKDRRKDDDAAQAYDGEERRKSTRRKAERRRQIDPTTCERDYTEQEIQFMRAMDDYKRKSGRQFPTWSEVLEVLRSLGYRQTEEPVEMVVRTS